MIPVATVFQWLDNIFRGTSFTLCRSKGYRRGSPAGAGGIMNISGASQWGRRTFTGVLPLLAACMLMAPMARAETVYKYVNEQGAITYSDSPPAATEDYEEITLRDYSPGDADAQRQTTEEMTRAAERLKADRRQREEDRHRDRPVPPPVVYTPGREEIRDPYLYPGYPYYYNRPHHRPRPQAPYRIDNPRDSMEDKLRKPITMPSFGGKSPLPDDYR